MGVPASPSGQSGKPRAAARLGQEATVPNADDFDDFYLDTCGQCDGEGWTFDCWDGLCVNAEDGCALCMQRCDFCNPRKASAIEAATAGETGTGSTEGESATRDSGGRPDNIQEPNQ